MYLHIVISESSRSWIDWRKTLTIFLGEKLLYLLSSTTSVNFCCIVSQLLGQGSLHTNPSLTLLTWGDNWMGGAQIDIFITCLRFFLLWSWFRTKLMPCHIYQNSIYCNCKPFSPLLDWPFAIVFPNSYCFVLLNGQKRKNIGQWKRRI